MGASYGVAVIRCLLDEFGGGGAGRSSRTLCAVVATPWPEEVAPCKRKALTPRAPDLGLLVASQPALHVLGDRGRPRLGSVVEVFGVAVGCGQPVLDGEPAPVTDVIVGQDSSTTSTACADPVSPCPAPVECSQLPKLFDPSLGSIVLALCSCDMKTKNALGAKMVT